MAAARAEDERYAKPDPILEPKPVAVPVSPRIVAERLAANLTTSIAVVGAML